MKRIRQWPGVGFEIERGSPVVRMTYRTGPASEWFPINVTRKDAADAIRMIRRKLAAIR